MNQNDDHEPTATAEANAADGDTPPQRGLFSLLVDRPVFTMMITLAMLLVGTISLFRLPLAFMGEGMSSSSVHVMISVGRPRSPEENDDKVARPAEELLRTIAGLRSITSRSSSDWVRLTVELNPDMDPILASAEIRDRMQRALLQFPVGVDQYFTWRQDGSSAPLHYFQILTPEVSAEWQEKVENVVIPRLEAVDGVGRVDIFGLRRETIRIRFDPDKLLAQRVDYRGLLQRLTADNYTEPAGELDNGSERVLLRIDSKFRSLSDIEDFPVRPGLLVKDVAVVERDRRDSDSLSRFNERFTFTGSIRATAGVNPVQASDRVRRTSEQLKEDPRLAGIDFRYLFDQGEFIRKSLDNLFEASFSGGALALLVLFLFLRSVRSTIAIGIAIPLTLLLVADYLFFTGDSLNILTMTGMTLAVGMVVDNSVVVLENIRRLRHEGRSLYQACVQGAREVSLAVTMATLTTVVVFVPIIFMGTSGQMRSNLGAVGIPLSVALIGSLFVALLLLPSGVRWIGGVSAASEVRWRLWSPVDAMIRLTLVLVRRTMAHRYKILFACVGYVVLLASGLIPGPIPHLPFETGDQNPFRSSDVNIQLSLQRGRTDDEVLDEVRLIEQALLSRKEELRIDSLSVRFNRTSIRMDIALASDVRSDQFASFGKKIRKILPRRPGIKEVVGGREAGAAEEQDQRNFVVRVRGRDSEHLAGLGLRLSAILEARPEVEMVEVAAVEDNEEVVVDVDRDRLQEFHVSPQTLFGTLSGGLQGRDLTRFEEGGRDVRLVSQFSRIRDPSLNDLKETRVFADGGNYQRISDVTQVGFRKTLGSIDRLDGHTTITILGKRAEGVTPNEFSSALTGIMAKFPLPRGYSWSEDSMSNRTAAQIQELLEAGALSVVLVFLLMGILFESVVLPGAILITIVIAILGGLWSLKLFHGAIDPMAITGLILLAGVVVNNGIVLLDCIERLRHQGMSREDAIRDGIRIRLRPIMMTASTTIVGLLPMAIWGENAGQGVNYVSLSITVAGGLALCTLLTAGAVSIAYTWLDDLSDWLNGTLRRAFRPN